MEQKFLAKFLIVFADIPSQAKYFFSLQEAQVSRSKN